HNTPGHQRPGTPTNPPPSVSRHGGEISAEDLATETGLTPEQIEVGVMWKNLEFLRFKRRQGGDGPGATGPDGGS
ncbi:hypothetical protein, partial [Streptomyces sp. CC53]|uniref:hypothetical protein n=1 Tax=Streptomyces sp. CC53 TaxID=1906740 RepID=UPI001C42F126